MVALVSTLASNPSLEVALHLMTIMGVALIVAATLHFDGPLHRMAVALLAIAVVAGQWPLLAGDLGRATGASAGDGALVAARTISELALVFGVILFALATRGLWHHRRSAWLVGAVSGLVVLAMLASRPDYTAILALWAMGATLSLPPGIYVVGAIAAGVAVLGWLASPHQRIRIAGLALIVIVGLQPPLVHHNLTALLGLALLALPAQWLHTPARTAHVTGNAQ